MIWQNKKHETHCKNFFLVTKNTFLLIKSKSWNLHLNMLISINSFLISLVQCPIPFTNGIQINEYLILPFRVIQYSHPVCNTIMLFGIIICLISVILLGIDGRFVDEDTYPTVTFISLIILLLKYYCL